MNSSDRIKYIEVALKIIVVAVISWGMTKLSNMETGINTLNVQMGTIIERSINQDKRIDRLEAIILKGKI
jgi:hypothetical protein